MAVAIVFVFDPATNARLRILNYLSRRLGRCRGGSHFVSRPIWARVVKRSSDLRTSNFKFEFVFVFQPFDIWIQASLIRQTVLWSAVPYSVWQFFFVLYSSNARRVFCLPLPLPFPSPTLPSFHCIPPRRSVTLSPVSYTHLTLPTIERCRSRWSPYH